MTTQINTTPVRIESAKRKITQRLFKNNIPGGNRNPIDTLGFNGLTINVKGYARTPEDYDTVVAEMFDAPFKLYLKDDWYYNCVLEDFNVPTLDSLNYFPFDVKMACEEPFMYSDTETTRSKTITTNNQEWSADDDGFGIVTNGNVEAVPDIQVTGSSSSVYKRGGVSTTDLDSTQYNPTGTSWTLVNTVTLSAVATHAWHISNVSFDLWTGGVENQISYGKATITAASLYSGVETDLYEANTDSASRVSFSSDEDEFGAINEQVLIKFYGKSNDAFAVRIDETSVIYNEARQSSAFGVQVYNTADTTIKADICNDIQNTAIVRINSNGTGTYQYSDDFTTDQHLYANYTLSGITHDAGDDELDIADDGYIYYDIDVKYPITGIPTVTAQIDITAGIPTIQISSDGSTWYDIDTAIVDDISTEYELDNASNLSLKGLTTFYLRFDCVKVAAATCSIKLFTLDVDIVTVDVPNVSVNTGTTNTFRCDQDSDSGLSCEIVLTYRDRKWT